MTICAARGERASPEVATPAVRLRDVWFGYRKREPVLRSISLDVGEGELLMVLGASGSGKSTLLKLVKGLLAPQRGEIMLCGSPLQARQVRDQLDPATAYIPQQLGLIRSRTVLENVLLGALSRTASWRALLGVFPRETVALARDTIGALGLAHKTNEKVRSLSGGERQRVAIARALVQKPRVLIADELVSQLDPATTAGIMELIRQVAATGVTVLMTTHELHVVTGFADELVVLRGGAKVLQSAAQGLTPAELERLMKP
ncbi:MAG: ATP-binding cassette domain-containing protein [Tepidiformaceae bacterium]